MKAKLACEGNTGRVEVGGGVFLDTAAEAGATAAAVRFLKVLLPPLARLPLAHQFAEKAAVAAAAAAVVEAGAGCGAGCVAGWATTPAAVLRPK